GLGGTVGELAARLGSVAAKTSFSSVSCREIAAALERSSPAKWLVAGIETHVCIQQTVLDLLAGGFHVYLAVDATGSRFDIDRQRRVEERECLRGDGRAVAARARGRVTRQVEGFQERYGDAPLFDEKNAPSGLLGGGRGIPAFHVQLVVVEHGRVRLQDFGG